MLHLILTASSDESRVSIHWTLREIDEDRTETTLRVAGSSMPLYELGLFGEERQALYNALLEVLRSDQGKIVSTDQ